MSAERDCLIADLWSANSAAWISAVRGGHDHYREAVIDPAIYGLLPDIKGLSVLDVGCGEGRDARRLAGMGAAVTAVDISPAMIAAAISASEKSLGIRYIQDSAESLSHISGESFDLIVSMMAYMNISDLSVSMTHAFRALRPGGRLFFSVLHPCFTARGGGWVKDATGTVTGYLMGDYKALNPQVARWRLNESADYILDLRFPYSLSNYINAVASAGFRINEIIEPITLEHPVPLALIISASC